MVREFVSKILNTLVHCLIMEKKKIPDLDFNLQEPWSPSIFEEFLAQDKEKEKEKESDELQWKTHSIQTLKRLLIPISQVLFACENQEKLVTFITNTTSPLINQLISQIPKTLYKDITILFNAVLNQYDHLAKVYKKEAMEYLMSGEFFMRMNEDTDILHLWKGILQIVVNVNYADKSVIIIDILGKISSTIFSSKESEIQQKIRNLKRLSFIIYSGGQDDYTNCIGTVIEKLVDYLKTESYEIRCTALFCLRVMFYKLSLTSLQENWYRFWPHLASELITTFKQSKDQNLTLQAVKLIELLSTIKCEDFHLQQWIFLCDVFGLKIGEVQEPTHEFIPYLQRIFIQNKVSLFNEDILNENKPTTTTRQLCINFTNVYNDELAMKGPALIGITAVNNVERVVADVQSIEDVIDNDFLDFFYPY